MNYYLLVTMILSSISGLFAVTKQFQMLQQNSYFPSRYINWLKDNLPQASIFVFLILSVLFYMKQYMIQMIFAAIILGCNIYWCIYNQKKSIKKLIFTARIKRLFTVGIFVCLIPILLYTILSNTLLGGIFYALLILISTVTPFLTIICWALTFPIEQIISKSYIRNAKKILNEHKNLKVIGITGSYGKTSLKFILTRILSENFNVVCTPHSFNTTMGVVRTIREKLQPQTEIFVCEMGAKNIGDIKEICDIVSPEYAVITSVGPQHLETFKSIENIFKTKFELVDSVKKNNGKIFINGNSKEIYSRINPKEFIIYGTNNGFNFKAENIKYGKDGSEFTINLGNQQLLLTSKLLGLHSIINIIGAVSVAYSLGMGHDDIKYAVASLKPTEHRLEIKPSLNGSIMIDDAYNANPEGSIEAVRILDSFDGMQKVIITPGLIELGSKEYECNFALGLEAAKICDIIILVGKNRSKPLSNAVDSTEFNKNNLYIAENFMEAMNIYSRFADTNTVLLIENDLPDNYLN